MTVIDSMAVFTNGDKTIVNTNDCPYDIAKEAVQMIKDKYGQIDLLMTGYMGAGPYPQCYDIPNLEKWQESVKKKNTFLEKSANYVDVLKPKMTMPFAGQYVLSGRLTSLNEYRGVPNYWETNSFFRRRCPDTDLLFLNAHQWYDLETDTVSKDYDIPDDAELRDYQNNILSFRKMDYEKKMDYGEIKGRLVRSYYNMERKRKEIEYNSDTVVYIHPYGYGYYIRITMNGEGVSTVSNIIDKNFIRFEVDSRLLEMILDKKTMWQVAEWGSHITFYRENNEFDRGIHYCMNFFHV
jgi:UDP-MurNAc hydroxylase